jgi:hypothetical protein
VLSEAPEAPDVPGEPAVPQRLEEVPWSASMLELELLLRPLPDACHAFISSRETFPSWFTSMSWKSTATLGAATCISASESLPSLSVSAWVQCEVEISAVSLLRSAPMDEADDCDVDELLSCELVPVMLLLEEFG